MAMSKGVAMGSIVIGCGLLVLTLISVICGGVAMSKLTSPAAVSIGLWGMYFGVPGVLSVIAGHKKVSNMLGVALGTHIIGTVLAIVGAIIAAVFWAILDSKCSTPFFGLIPDRCTCLYDSERRTYEASCDDLKTVRNATGAVTIIFVFCAIVTFVGSIYGCIGTCCAPREPGVVIRTTVPAHTNTVVVTNSAQQSQAYYMQQPQASGMQQPQAYSVQQPQAYGMQQSQAYGMQPPPYAEPGAVAEGQVIEKKC